MNSRTNRQEVREVPIWERRLAVWITTGLVGFIAVVAVEMKTDVEVIKTNFKNTIDTIKMQSTTIEKHGEELRNHDRRLIKVEQKVYKG